MERSPHQISVSALSALGLAASRSRQGKAVRSQSAATARQRGAPSGMSLPTAQALLTYLRGCGVCDACAVELITYCARRALEAN
jgi:hypothetical protein